MPWRCKALLQIKVGSARQQAALALLLQPPHRGGAQGTRSAPCCSSGSARMRYCPALWPWKRGRQQLGQRSGLRVQSQLLLDQTQPARHLPLQPPQK